MSKTVAAKARGQSTGMTGVYLVAAEISSRGLIVSPTSRSAFGADLLVTDRECKKAWSVQVKTNASVFGHWLLNERAKKTASPSHIYVFVNRPSKGPREFFIVPSRVVARTMESARRPKGTWFFKRRLNIESFENKWSRFGAKG